MYKSWSINMFMLWKDICPWRVSHSCSLSVIGWGHRISQFLLFSSNMATCGCFVRGGEPRWWYFFKVKEYCVLDGLELWTYSKVFSVLVSNWVLVSANRILTWSGENRMSLRSELLSFQWLCLSWVIECFTYLSFYIY